MYLLSAHEISVSVRRREKGVKDSRGNPVLSWLPVEQLDKCFFYPVLSSTEGMPERQSDLEDYVLYAPIGTELDVEDRVLARGEWYKVVSPPLIWPGGRYLPLPGRVEVRLRRSDG